MEEEKPDRPVARPAAPRPQPARTRTAEVLERNERPIPVDQPGVVAGFEEHFTDPEGRRYRRADLVAYATNAQEEAMKLGLTIETITPTMSANSHLVAWGRRVRPILSAARAEAEAARADVQAEVAA